MKNFQDILEIQGQDQEIDFNLNLHKDKKEALLSIEKIKMHTNSFLIFSLPTLENEYSIYQRSMSELRRKK